MKDSLGEKRLTLPFARLGENDGSRFSRLSDPVTSDAFLLVGDEVEIATS